MKDMWRHGLLLLFSAAFGFAEVRTMTLREAVARALSSHPDVVIARLNEQIAAESVRVTRGPFSPRVVFGSGLAYSNGFPMSIEGSAPSIIQGRAIQSIYNRPLSFQAAAAKENARAAGLDTNAKREEVAFRTASLYLDAERLARQAELAAKQVEALERVADVVRARVQEGRELEIENRRAAFNVAQARQRVTVLGNALRNAESNLAVALGFPPEDRIRAAGEERGALELAGNIDAMVDEALGASKELRRLEAAMRSKALEVQSARSERFPQLDLVAQYGLFAKFNNYEEFFRRFQRHNGQIGVSITLPVLPGSGASAQAARASLEMTRLRTEFASARDRIALDTRLAHQEVQNAESAREVARLDLDLAREQLSVLLAQFQEGRVPLRQVEEARAAETTRWMTFYDAEAAVERARFDLLRRTGAILSAMK